MFRKIPANCGSCQQDDTIESYEVEGLDVTRVIQRAFNTMAEKKQVPKGGTVGHSLAVGRVGTGTGPLVLGVKIDHDGRSSAGRAPRKPPKDGGSLAEVGKGARVLLVNETGFGRMYR